MSLYLGIDPGLSGAIAALKASGEILWVEDMPIIAVQRGRSKHEIDMPGLWQLIMQREQMEVIGHVALEVQQSMPGQGVASMFKIGEGYGALRMMLAGMRLPHTLVRANEWRKFHRLQPGKDASLQRARSLWPECVLLDRKKDHGRADALLIAEWGRVSRLSAAGK